ncbi:serine hydrolase [Myroides sp. LJL116]
MSKWRVLALCIGLLIGQAGFSMQKPGDPMEKFYSYFKQSDFSGFYQDYSDDLQADVTQVQSEKFIENLQATFGQITSYSSIVWNNSPTKMYEVQFSEGDTFIFGFRENTKGQVDYFQIFTLPSMQGQQNFLQADLSSIVSQSLDSLSVNTKVAIGLIDGDQIKSFQLTNKKGQLVFSEDNAEIFPILNLSDVFTNTLLAKDMQSKNIGLGKMANDYFDFPFKDNLELNLVALSNQITGLPALPDAIFKQNSQDKDKVGRFSKEDLERYLKDFVHSDTANAKVYSYLNGAIIAQVLQNYHQKEYSELLQESILTPYGMNQTFVGVPKKKKKLVGNLDDRAFLALQEKDAFIPSVGLYSTVGDLSKFIAQQFNKNNAALAFSRKPTAIISSSILSSIAWKVEQTYYNENYIYFNTGLSSSFVNMMVFDPIAQKGVVILSNAHTEPEQEQLFSLANALMMKLLYTSS